MNQTPSNSDIDWEASPVDQPRAVRQLLAFAFLDMADAQDHFDQIIETAGGTVDTEAAGKQIWREAADLLLKDQEHDGVEPDRRDSV